MSSEIELKEKSLKLLFDSFTEVSDTDQLELVESILSNIGEIDAEIEGLAGNTNQRDLSIKFHWGHNHRFSDSLNVKGRMGDRHINLMAQFMVKYNLDMKYFQNKNIVDVGCWTGGTLLLLKALGANEVLALEEVQKYAVVSNRLAQDLYKQKNVSCKGTNLYDLKAVKKYDIVYFPGVIYHLSDPVLALRRLFNVTKDGGEIFVESMGIDSKEPICEYHGNKVFHKGDGDGAKNLDRGGWNWFVPSPSCLSLWLEEAGFEDVDCYYSNNSNRVFGYGKRHKFNDITRAGFSVRNIE